MQLQAKIGSEMLCPIHSLFPDEVWIPEGSQTIVLTGGSDAGAHLLDALRPLSLARVLTHIVMCCLRSLAAFFDSPAIMQRRYEILRPYLWRERPRERKRALHSLRASGWSMRRGRGIC